MNGYVGGASRGELFLGVVQIRDSRYVHPCTPATFGPSMDVIATSKLVPPTGVPNELF
jgi:hypothetical protein